MYKLKLPMTVAVSLIILLVISPLYGADSAGSYKSGASASTIDLGNAEATAVICPPQFFSFTPHDSFYICSGATIYDTIKATSTMAGVIITITKVSGPGSFSSTPSLSPAYGYFNYTPTASGSFTVTYQATDDDGRSAQATKTYFVFINQPPVITVRDSSFYDCYPGFPYTYELIASDPESDPLQFRLLSGTGSIDESSGLMTFSADTSGKYCFKVEVSDSCASDTGNFCIDIVLNSTPQMNGFLKKITLCAVDTICFSVFADDPDSSDSLVITQYEGPGSFQMVDSISGMTCFLPDDIDSADYIFVYGVTDNCLRGEIGKAAATPPFALDTVIITVIIGQTVDLVCPGDTSMFICSPDTICLPIDGIPDSAQVTVSPSSAWYSPNNKSICFYTNCSVNKDLKIVVNDICGTDSCHFVAQVKMNSSPLVILGRDTSLFACQSKEICLAVGISDVNNNISDISVSPGAKYNGTTGTVCITPATSGDYAIFVKAVDSCGAVGIDTAHVRVTINKAPVVISAADFSVEQCQPVEICFPVSISDSDNTVQSVTVLPSGTYNSSTGKVCFVPSAGGYQSVIISAIDSCGAIDADTTVVNVILNSPPVVLTVSDSTVFLCDTELICFPAFATDVDSNVSSVVISGATYSNGYGCFTPIGSGEYQFVIRATDSCGAIGIDTAFIKVVINTPPIVVLPPDSSVFQCTLGPICIDVGISDLNNNIETISSNIGAYNSETNQVCFTPGAVGTYKIIVTASDSCYASAADTTLVTVTTGVMAHIECPTGSIAIHACGPQTFCYPLVITPSDAMVTTSYGRYSDDTLCFYADTSGTYRIDVAANSECGMDNCQLVFDVTIDQTAQIDCPADTSVVLCNPQIVCRPLGVIPSWAQVTVSPLGSYNNGNVCFTPDTAGQYELFVKASTECGVDSCYIKVNVSYNEPPVIETTDTSHFACEPGMTYFHTIYASDFEGDAISYDLLSSFGTIDENNGKITFIADTAGIYCFMVTASDQCGADTARVCITVTENRAPVVISGPDSSIFLCAAEEICVPVSIDDADDNVVSITSNIGTYEQGQICFTPTGSGNYQIITTAVDSCGAEAVDTTNISVSFGQQAQVDCPPETTIVLCKPELICRPVTILPEESPVTISPIGYYQDGMVCFTPESAGRYEFLVTAAAQCGTDSCRFVVNVTFNQRPVISAPDTSYFSCQPGQAFSYIVQSSDFENDVITYNLLSFFGSIDPISGKTDFIADTSGLYCFDVTASDYCGADTAHVCITVKGNTAPIVISAPDTTVYQCGVGEICIAVNISDIDDNIASISSNLGAFADGRVCFTPPEAGVYDIITTAVDSCGAGASDTTTVTVQTATPISLQCPHDTSVFICQPDTVCLPLGGVPEGAVIAISPISARYIAATQSICFYTNCSTVKYIKIIVATDCGKDSCSFRVNVTMNSKPLALLAPDTTIFMCQTGPVVCIPAGISDVDDNIIDIETSSGASYNSITGKACFTPDGAGIYKLTLKATDACGAYGIDSVKVNVVMNEPPVVSSGPDFSVSQCNPTEICFPMDISDPNNNITKITVSPTGSYNSAEGVVCFTPTAAGSYRIVTRVEDGCGIIAVDTTTVVVSFDQAADIICPADTTVFLCRSDSVSRPIGITPLSAAVIVIPAGVYHDGKIWFKADTSGIYDLTVIAQAECGSDTCHFRVDVNINDAPVVAAGNDTTYFQCAFSSICRPIMINDLDNNIQTITVTPLGTYDPVKSEVCFTPTAVGTNCLIITATDACGLSAADTVCVTVTSGSVAEIACPISPFEKHLCNSGQVCVPLTVTPADAQVTLSNGAFSGNQVCFQADTAGSYHIRAVASAACGSDTCDITVNVIFDKPAVIDCPQLPASVSLCAPDSVKIIVPITPSNATVTVSPRGSYNFSSHTVSFYADTAGTYRLTIIASTLCGIDTCTLQAIVTMDHIPQISCPGDFDTVICIPEISEICFPVTGVPVGATTKILPSGSYGGGIVCVPITGAGIYGVSVIASTLCGADTCKLNIEVIANEAPTMTVPESTAVPGCDDDLNEICIDGIFATDPEGDALTITKTCGPGTFTPVRSDSGYLCFTPVKVDSTYYFCFEATDGCQAVSKTFILTIYRSPACAICVDLAIETDSCYVVGMRVPVKLVLTTREQIGGFALLLSYDATVLNFLGATKGSAVSGWEYFTYRLGTEGNCTDNCPSGMVRLVGIADINNGAPHPPEEQLLPQGILAQLTMQISNDQNLGGQYLPIGFYWGSCGDNAFTDPTGNMLFVDNRIYNSSDVLIWDESNDTQYPESKRTVSLGVPDSCVVGDKTAPLRCIDFHNGGVCVKSPEEIDARGDINLNEVAYEIGDAVVFTNYFLYGLDAFTVSVAGQTAASDVNADGLVLTVSDLVYLIRVITGDADPLPKISPELADINLKTALINNMLSVSVQNDYPVGAGLLVFKYSGMTPEISESGESVSGMNIKYNTSDSEIRVLIFSFERGAKIETGFHDLLKIKCGSQGAIHLTEASFAGYYGELLIVRRSDDILPQAFSLSQNYPNPFNPSTSIELSMPVSSEWRLTIYNINGQIVKRLKGQAEPGTITINWDGHNENSQPVTSGIYFYKVEAGSFSATRKMILLK